MARRAGVVSVDVDPNLSQVGSKIDAFARALKPLGIRVEAVDKFSSVIGGGVRTSQASLNSISTSKAQGELTSLGSTGERQLARVNSGAKTSGASLVAIGAGATFVGTKLVGSLKPAVDAASDLNEAVSYSKQVFGDSAGEIEKFAGTAASKLGQSKKEATEGATTFATFGKAAGLAGKDLVGFSTSLVKLAADLASAKNTTGAEAITAIGAALRGETEPIRQYGVLLDDATIRQEAFALGLVKTTKDALTPQQKVLAVQSLLFKQTSDAQGDFARTADGAANSAKILNAQLENTKADSGKGLLGVLSAANKAGGEVLNVLNEIPGATTALGVAVAGIGAAVVGGGVVTSLLGARRALKEFAAERVAASAAKVGADAAETVSTGALTAAAGAEAVAEGDAAVAIEAATAASTAAIPATEGLAAAQGTAAASAQGLAAANGELTAVGGASRFAGLTTGLSGVAVGFTAAAVAAAGFGYAIKKNNDGFNESINALTDGTDRIKDALKFPKRAESVAVIQDIADILGKTEKVGPQSAVDRIKDFFGAFDKSDETENRVARQAAQLKILGDTMRSLPADQARDLFERVRTALGETGISATEARDTLAKLEKQLLAQEAAAGVVTGSTDAMSGSLDRFGLTIDATKGKWEQYTDTLTGIMDPINAASSAQAALTRGQDDLADKQKKLQDILAGNSEGVKSAREALNDAKADLNKAIASTGPGSDAAESALQSLHSALKELHDAQVESGKAPREGDFFDDRRQQVADAEARVRKAQRDLDKANSRNSDEVVSARDKVTAAQKRLNDELAKTGPRSQEAIDAQKAVDDAERAMPGLVLAVETANAKLRDELEKHPEAIAASIKKVDEWAAKGLISKEVARQWKEELLQALAASQGLVDNLGGGQPTKPNGPDTAKPGARTGGPGRSGEQDPSGFKPTDHPIRKDLPTIRQVDSYFHDLPSDPTQINTKKVYVGKPDVNKPATAKYVYDKSRGVWQPVLYADGGFLEDDRTVRRPIGSQFPTQPGILPNRPGGLTKIVGFEGRQGQWEGFIPGDLSKRPQAVRVTREIAQRFGYDLIEKKKLTRVAGASVRAFADGGFLGAPAAKPAPIVAPAEGQTVASEASIRELIAEVRSLRGEQMTTLRDMIRAATGAGSTEPLAPLLRAIEGNTRNRGPGGFAGMADLRQREAGLAR